MRINLIMACDACKNRNYSTNKNKTKTPDRLSKKKYCKSCRKHTVHKETK